MLIRVLDQTPKYKPDWLGKNPAVGWSQALGRVYNKDINQPVTKIDDEVREFVSLL